MAMTSAETRNRPGRYARSSSVSKPPARVTAASTGGERASWVRETVEKLDLSPFYVPGGSLFPESMT